MMKECPFCKAGSVTIDSSSGEWVNHGKRPMVEHHVWVRCMECNARGPEFRGVEPIENLIQRAGEAWNDR